MTQTDLATLRQRQSLPLEAKVLLTRQRLRQWQEHYDGDVYLAFSGGKDSTVLLDIIRSSAGLDGIPAVFCDTGLEYPEVRELALKKADVVLRPKMNFRQVIERYGYPIPSKEQALYIRQLQTTKSEKLRDLRLNGRNGTGMVSTRWLPLVSAPFKVSERCCDVMKKAPFKAYSKETGRKGIIATMAVESKLREQKYLMHGCNAFDTKEPTSTPLAFWTEQDVLRYIVSHGLEYAGCYGEIAEGRDGALRCTREDRTGCMFCMFGVHFDGNPNRFQRMQRDYPMQWRFCMEQLDIKEVLEYVGIPYEYQPTLFDLPTDEGGYK